MSSTTYPVDTPRWLWDLFKRAIDDGTDYDKYNDRLVEAIAVDVQRFNQAGMLELDETERARIQQLLSDVGVDDEAVPRHSDGIPLTDPRGPPSSMPDPRGEGKQ